MSFRSKLMAVLALACLLPAVVLILLVWNTNVRLVSRLQDAALADAQASTATIVRSVHALVSEHHEIVLRSARSALKAAQSVAAARGAVSLSSEVVKWEAVHQTTKEARSVSLPRLRFGEIWLGQVREASEHVPIIDDTVSLHPEVAVTVFQSMNEAGDMLRVATSVLNERGQRAVGTFLSATEPDGTPNPVIAAIRKGETYLGRALVLNDWYITAYAPLKDRENRLVGMLFAGVKQGNLEALKAKIRSVKVGKTGYVFVLGGKGDRRGRYVVSAGGKRDGENIWESRDADGKLFIQNLISAAMEQKPGEVTHVRYHWSREGESRPSMKISAVGYFEPWDWVLGAGSYEDELRAGADAVEAELRMCLLVCGLVLLLVLAGTMAFCIGFAHRVTAPLETITRAALFMASGDFSKPIEVREGGDEIGRLARAFREMAEAQRRQIAAATEVGSGNLGCQVSLSSERDELGIALRRMIGSIRDLVETCQVTISSASSSAAQLSGASQSLSAGAAEQAASVEEIASAMSKVAADVKVSAQEAERADENSATAKTLAARGQDQLQRSLVSMEEIAASNQRISSIVKTIDDIAFQTNLLALNAAVEAARAGRHGKGFAVVAEEVRNLAMRSGLAARETTEIIEAGRRKSDEGVTEIQKSWEAFQKIAAQVTDVADSVGRMAQQSRSQSASIEEMSKALAQVGSVTQHTSSAAEETAATARDLAEQTASLRESIAHFRV